MSMCEEDLKMIQDLVKAGKEIEKRWVEGKRIVKKKRKKKKKTKKKFYLYGFCPHLFCEGRILLWRVLKFLNHGYIQTPMPCSEVQIYNPLSISHYLHHPKSQPHIL